MFFSGVQRWKTLGDCSLAEWRSFEAEVVAAISSNPPSKYPRPKQALPFPGNICYILSQYCLFFRKLCPLSQDCVLFQLVCVTGFEGDDRIRVKHMLMLIGAKYTGYLTAAHSVLIAKSWVNIFLLQVIMNSLVAFLPKYFFKCTKLQGFASNLSMCVFFMKTWREEISKGDGMETPHRQRHVVARHSIGWPHSAQTSGEGEVFEDESLGCTTTTWCVTICQSHG